jgi:hypothetical protein
VIVWLIALALQVAQAPDLPARVLEGRGERGDIPAALAALAREPEPERRARLAGFLGRADLGAEALAQRGAALESLARTDPAESVRAQAVEALADSWQGEAWLRLDGLLDGSDALLRPHVARAIAGRARLAPRIVARVLAAASAGEDPRVLAPLLGVYGRALADLPQGGERPEERSALLAFARDPDPDVAEAARAARLDLFRRLRARSEPERALRLADALAAQGADADECARQRIQTALAVGRDAGEALKAARELAGRAACTPGPERAPALADARMLEAISLIALQQLPAAEEVLVGVKRALDVQLAACGRDRSQAGAAREAQLWGLRARAELIELLRLLSASTGPEPGGAALASAAELQRAALHWQLCASRAHGGRLASLDEVLSGADSPLALLCENPWRPGLDPGRALELQRSLGRTLASVAPRELPGFEPWPGAGAGGLADPARAALYRELLGEEARRADEQLGERLGRVLARERGDPTGIEPAEERELAQLDSARRALAEEQAAAGRGDEQVLYDLRTPSGLALDLARALREEGRNAEAAALAGAAETALEHDPSAQRFLWGVELRAECEVLRGNAQSDMDKPAEAELDLARALDRLQALEDELARRGVPRAALGRLRATRSSVLVGLAVNANVKQKEQQKALAYFERAWELRQDDFMKALRACYLARAARSDEARALLREIVPAPETLYNLACTWALLGDREQALAYLERDFEQNLPTPGMRARQQHWARGDPDLESLRGEPRFESLLAR